MSEIDPGKLNKRIEFGYITNEKDKEGFLIKTWNTFKKCHAAVKGLRGREFYNAATVKSEDDKIFNCRYFKGLKSSMYIKYNGYLYDITSINDLNETHVEYEIHAKEVKQSG